MSLHSDAAVEPKVTRKRGRPAKARTE